MTANFCNNHIRIRLPKEFWWLKVVQISIKESHCGISKITFSAFFNISYDAEHILAVFLFFRKSSLSVLIKCVIVKKNSVLRQRE